MMVSFVVIAYNEEQAIGRCLKSILQQRGLTDWEVIVVDDGSTDDTASCVREVAAVSPQTRLLSQGRNLGRGAARAAGVKAARGDLLAFVDADVILPVDWLERCLAAIDGLDAVGGIAIPDGDVSYVHRRFGLTPRPVPHSTTVTGSNGLFRRALFDRIRFDETLRDGEDVALGHDMKRAKASAATVPGLFVDHLEHKSYAASARWLYQQGQGATRQLARYRQPRRPDVVYVTTLGVVAGAVTAAWTGHVIGVAAVPLWLVGVAAAHLSSKFVARPGDALLLMAAVVTQAPLMAAYFAGRTAGIAGRQPWLGPQKRTLGVAEQ